MDLQSIAICTYPECKTDRIVSSIHDHKGHLDQYCLSVEDIRKKLCSAGLQLETSILETEMRYFDEQCERIQKELSTLKYEYMRYQHHHMSRYIQQTIESWADLMAIVKLFQQPLTYQQLNNVLHLIPEVQRCDSFVRAIQSARQQYPESLDQIFGLLLIKNKAYKQLPAKPHSIKEEIPPQPASFKKEQSSAPESDNGSLSKISARYHDPKSFGRPAIDTDSFNRMQNVSPRAKLKKPSPPKKPYNAFFLYKKEVYDQIKATNPGLREADISRLIADSYNKLPAEEQALYQLICQESKTLYEKDRNEYERQYGAIPNTRKKKKPERPVSRRVRRKDPSCDIDTDKGQAHQLSSVDSLKVED